MSSPKGVEAFSPTSCLLWSNWNVVALAQKVDVCPLLETEEKRNREKQRVENPNNGGGKILARSWPVFPVSNLYVVDFFHHLASDTLLWRPSMRRAPVMTFNRLSDGTKWENWRSWPRLAPPDVPTQTSLTRPHPSKARFNAAGRRNDPLLKSTYFMTFLFFFFIISDSMQQSARFTCFTVCREQNGWRLTWSTFQVGRKPSNQTTWARWEQTRDVFHLHCEHTTPQRLCDVFSVAQRQRNGAGLCVCLCCVFDGAYFQFLCLCPLWCPCVPYFPH